jgi:concentrative nucleoside transporter, CNT family
VPQIQGYSMTAYLLEYNRYLNIIGIGVILVIATIFSHDRNKINVRLVLSALGLQILIGFIALKTEIGQSLIGIIASGVRLMYECADAGSAFLFGNLVDPSGSWAFLFAFQVLPVIIFFGAFMSLMFYLGIIQVFIKGISIVIRPVLGTSGAETLCAIANSFLGQTEAPLVVRHYLKTMTRSELLVVMVSGMATISGALLVALARMGVPSVHMLAAAVMAIPGSILVAKILHPETSIPKTSGGAEVTFEDTSANVFDALANGALDGLHLSLNVGAMLIAFIALLALGNSVLVGFLWLCNMLLGAFGLPWSVPIVTLSETFGFVFAPIGFLLGFEGDLAFIAGKLLGVKLAANEVIALGDLVTFNLSERATAILTYALCGFSNFSCIGIQIGGIGALIPRKRSWITQLGLTALLGGTLTNLLSAMIAGLLL